MQYVKVKCAVSLDYTINIKLQILPEFVCSKVSQHWKMGKGILDAQTNIKHKKYNFLSYIISVLVLWFIFYKKVATIKVSH